MMEARVIRTPFHYRGKTIYVDRVPAWVCNRCGERYFDATVYKRLEVLARSPGRLRRKITFPLATYSAGRRV
jgi:YgiT-type zinc finger domain-containing protein